ncbi:hypothetical protein pETSU_265 [Edwardsiella phage pEt-SU]|uniref:Uncharacterized protein n=1 Tax=Edwardsiella phage pEt-SU TaxID=2562142 RepID=A0A4D6DYI4_9CAUD|nr:hypothetical protein HOV39_gp257 [Edwardsiella phage pEt-SU]QBZ70846.1 hypothetical protein pETSU_265 [Edwardsiella phage pEt-SU]
MIVTKESLRTIAELATQHIADNAIVTGKFVEDLNGDIVLTFDNKVDIPRDFASCKITHHGLDLGTIQIPDLNLFYKQANGGIAPQLWQNKTASYIYRQLLKYLVKLFMHNDPAMIDVKTRIEQSDDVVQWSVSNLQFFGHYSKQGAGLKVKDGQTILYENIKSNKIGVTTELGYQALNINNVIGDASRVLMTAVGLGMTQFPVEV